jgi:hypothetical protein
MNGNENENGNGARSSGRDDTDMTDMGEWQSGGGPRGRRRVHPGVAVPEDAGLAALLGAALREGVVDAEAEKRAVAAFREARDAGTHVARTRRRDDWRPRDRYRIGRSAKATLAVILASLTLGGVAMAAIGSAGSSHKGGEHSRTHSSTLPPSPPASEPSASATPDRPATAKDTVAHCQAYEKVKGNGEALESTAWQRLIAAAGGAQHVEAYCAEQLAAQTSKGKPSKTPKAEKSAQKATKAVNSKGKN